MIAGPFDLRGTGSGSFYLKYWNNSEYNFDFFKWMVSANGTNYYGYVHSGNSGGWITGEIDLANVPTIGNVLGDDSIWVALTFDSDATNQNQGVFVDSVTVEVYGSAPGAFAKYSPSNGATNVLANSAFLDWSDSSGALHYEYCYDTTNDNSCSIWVNTGMSTSASLSGLSYGTTYYWQVRAVNNFGTTLANSDTYWSFTTGTPPVAFNKSSPANGAGSQPTSLTLSWTSSSNATSYSYCYDTTNDNTCGGLWVGNGASTSTAIRVRKLLTSLTNAVSVIARAFFPKQSPTLSSGDCFVGK
jgi:hypothetical protein